MTGTLLLLLSNARPVRLKDFLNVLEVLSHFWRATLSLYPNQVNICRGVRWCFPQICLFTARRRKWNMPWLLRCTENYSLVELSPLCCRSPLPWRMGCAWQGRQCPRLESRQDCSWTRSTMSSRRERHTLRVIKQSIGRVN